MRADGAMVAKARPTQNASTDAGSEPHPRVLLAEDNPIASEMLTKMGRKLGATMVSVENGAEALELVATATNKGKPFSLLMLDASMPVMGGVEVARRLRAAGHDPQDLPILAVTAATNPDEIRAYADAGMQAYLAKPVKISEFAAALDLWVSGGRNREAAMRKPGRALRLRYEERKAEAVTAIETLLGTDNRWEPADKATARDLLHKLAGTAGFFGDQQIGDACAAAENALVATDATDIMDKLQTCRQLLMKEA